MIELKDLKRENFNPDDFYKSATASRLKINNIPPQSAMVCLMKLADKMQFVRNKVNLPMIITSAFRSHELNKAIKGSPKSAHCQGLACDFLFSGKTPQESCELVVSTGVSFDQLLIENNVLHFGIKIRDELNRHEVAFATFNETTKKWELKKL
jgi:hypothetical protein